MYFKDILKSFMSISKIVNLIVLRRYQKVLRGFKGDSGKVLGAFKGYYKSFMGVSRQFKEFQGFQERSKDVAKSSRGVCERMHSPETP